MKSRRIFLQVFIGIILCGLLVVSLSVVKVGESKGMDNPFTSNRDDGLSVKISDLSLLADKITLVNDIQVFLPMVLRGFDDTYCEDVDLYEPNDSIATAMSLGDLISVTLDATIAPVSDIDWFSFTARETNSGIFPVDIDIAIDFSLNPSDNFRIRVYKLVDEWQYVCGPSEENPAVPSGASCNDGKDYYETITDQLGSDDSRDYRLQIFAPEVLGAICDRYRLGASVTE